MINYESGKKYTNRYKDVFWFEKHGDGVYSIEGNLQYWRVGGHENESGIDVNSYGMVDPSGGPFLCVNDFTINKKKCVRMFSEDETFLFEVEKDSE